MKLTENFFIKLAFIVIFILFAVYSLGIIVQKNIFLDGARIIFQTLQFSNFSRDYPQTRFLSTLLQAPLVITQRFLGDSIALKYSTFIIGFTHLFFLASSLIFTVKLALKNNKNSIAYLAIMSFMICLAPNITFLYNYAIDAFAVSWIMFSSYFFLQGNVRFKALVACSIALFFSYEPSILVFAIAIFTSLVFYRRNKNEYILIIIFIISACYQANMVLNVVAGSATDTFYNSAIESLKQPFQLWALLVIIIVNYFILINDSEKIKILIYILLGFAGLLIVILVEGGSTINSAFVTRTWLIPSLIVFFFSAGLILIRNLEYKITPSDLLFMFLLLIICSLNDIRQSKSWSLAKTELLNYQKNTNGCRSLTLEETLSLERKGMYHGHLVWYQVLLGGNTIIPNIVFPSSETHDSRSPNFNPCTQQPHKNIENPNSMFFLESTKHSPIKIKHFTD